MRICTTLREQHQSLELWYTAVVALYGLSALKGLQSVHYVTLGLCGIAKNYVSVYLNNTLVLLSSY